MNQIVGCQRQPEGTVDSSDSPKASLSKHTCGLQPAEDLLHSLANSLTDFISRVPNGMAIYCRSSFLLRHMRGSVPLLNLVHKRGTIIGLVHPHRDPLAARELLYHRQGSLSFGGPTGPGLGIRLGFVRFRRSCTPPGDGNILLESKRFARIDEERTIAEGQQAASLLLLS